MFWVYRAYGYQLRQLTYSYTVANYAAINISFGKDTISFKVPELKTDKVLVQAAGVSESRLNLFRLSVRKK